MALEEQDAGQEAEEEAPQEPRRKRFSGKKLVLFVVVPVFLLMCAGGGAAAYFLGYVGGHDEVAAEGEGGAAAEAIPENVVFYDLPEILVNLNTGGRQATYLKISIALELDNPDMLPRIENLLPRVIDNFQVYLRELRREDLNGSAGIFRLKEELLLRVNAALHPAHINDVLFKELLVQ